jgi:GDP-L-fucose synthase
LFKNKNVLVAGGAGFIGSHLILRLLKLGANVSATLHIKEPFINDSKINYLRCDLRSPEDCLRVTKNVDYVFMCAANTSGAAVMTRNPLAHLTPNILMNISMLDAAYENDIKKFLFISSNTVYPLTDFPVKEEDVTNEFYDKYFIVAWMKRFTEIVCQMYSEKISKPMDVCVVRPANVYGEFEDFEWETSHVIPALIRKVVERMDPLEVWGDGNDLKEFIYIDDFIDGLLLSMEKLTGFDPINIAISDPCTVKEIVNLLVNLDGYENANIIYDTSKPSMIPKRLIDNQKAVNKLGFSPKVSLEEGLKKTLKWYRSSIDNDNK